MPGSSPRVWGRWLEVVHGAHGTAVHPHACGADTPNVSPKGLFDRFIPTRVGQMQRCRQSHGVPRSVHPHACGADDYCRRERPRIYLGSSPRVWGRCVQNCRLATMGGGSSPRVWGRCLRLLAVFGPQRRFIPTRVGQMYECPNLLRAFVAVHPHACGADSSVLILLS